MLANVHYIYTHNSYINSDKDEEKNYKLYQPFRRIVTEDFHGPVITTPHSNNCLRPVHGIVVLK